MSARPCRGGPLLPARLWYRVSMYCLCGVVVVVPLPGLRRPPGGGFACGCPSPDDQAAAEAAALPKQHRQSAAAAALSPMLAAASAATALSLFDPPGGF